MSPPDGSNLLDPEEFTAPEVVIRGDLGSGSMVLRPPKGSGVKLRRRAPGEAAGTRKENDAYDTDPAVALACMEWIRDRMNLDRAPDPGPGLRILDPTAGTGPFVKAAHTVFAGSVIAAGDLRPECEKVCMAAGARVFRAGDSLEIPTRTIELADLIVTNPPFTLADPLARHFYWFMSPGAVLAFLLNVTFIGAQERWAPDPMPEGDTDGSFAGLFKAAPLTYMVPIQPRPQFLNVNSEGKKTSSPIECALFVWVKGKETIEINGVEHPSPGALIPPEPIRWKKESK
jgi:hypothetical protein